MHHFRPAFFLVPVFIILQFAAGSIAAADVGGKTVDRELIRRIIASRMASPVTKPQEFTNPFGTRSAPSEEECIASPIHFQQWTNARLETSDCVLESGQYWDVYYFEALAGEQADVHMYENWFDTVLL